jgi:hypothetical protein
LRTSGCLDQSDNTGKTPTHHPQHNWELTPGAEARDRGSVVTGSTRCGAKRLAWPSNEYRAIHIWLPEQDTSIISSGSAWGKLSVPSTTMS